MILMMLRFTATNESAMYTTLSASGKSTINFCTYGLPAVAALFFVLIGVTYMGHAFADGCVICGNTPAQDMGTAIANLKATYLNEVTAADNARASGLEHAKRVLAQDQSSNNPSAISDYLGLVTSTETNYYSAMNKAQMDYSTGLFNLMPAVFMSM